MPGLILHRNRKDYYFTTRKTDVKKLRKHGKCTSRKGYLVKPKAK